MKYLRKIECIVPVLLLFLLLGCTACAEEAEDFVTVNPLYESVVSEEDLLTFEETEKPTPRGITETPSFTGSTAAAAYLKKEMVARETSITFTLVSSSALTSVKDTVYALVSLAMEDDPDGAPDEGDYLKWHYSGYRGKPTHTVSGSKHCYEITLAVTYFSSAAQEKKLGTDLTALIRSMDLSGKSDYEKAKAIYDYVIDHVTYDYAHLGDSTYKLQFSAYAAFENGTAVCQGYASLVYRMMRMAGLSCRFISGYGGTVRHGWNIVKIGAVYYNLDSTWDSDSGTYTYFLKSNADFLKHTRDARFRTDAFNSSYPMASASYNLNGTHEHAWDTVYSVDTEATCAAAGSSSLHCTICGAINPESVITVSKTAHTYGSWTVTTTATIFSAGEKERSCSVCGRTQTKAIKKKTAKVTLNAEKITLQVGQTTTAVTIKFQTTGDSVSKWTSSDRSVVTVRPVSGRIRAVKKGTATLTLTMKSGATATLTVKVQKGQVKTTSLKAKKKSVVLSVGQTYKLKLTRLPITANDKLTYSSSKPGVAKVNSKGVITALSAGKTTIKIRSSGGKTAKCKITVK